MAFQQPQQRPRPARQLSIDQKPVQISAPISPARKRTIEESQEWILFSPQNDEQSVSQSSRTPRTATHRTLSDIASLETHIRSHDNPDDSGTCLGTEIDDEAELDSLDDGLHAFQNPFAGPSNLDQSGGTVLPMHDGFGTFPSDATLQEHFWQFERHNPHRRSSKHLRRRSTVQKQLDELEEQQEVSPEDERTARIERWRLDQSRAVLEEIERETRRRRRRLSRMSTASSPQAIRQSLVESELSRTLTRQDSVIPEESETKADEQQPSESWWRRITRKVIQDLIGLDEATLSVIFGEQYIDEASPTPTAKSPIAAAAMNESRVAFRDPEPHWEVKLLDRIARELGILVHQLSEYDGTAFNAYKNAQEQQLEYAGLPRNVPRQPSLRQRRREEKARATGQKPENLFNPTVPQSPLTPATEPADTSLWGIEEEPDDMGDGTESKLQQEREYWEQEVDVKMIFSYLRNRFSREAPARPQQPTAADSIGPLPASWATVGTSQSAMGTSPKSQRRKEIIRQQHPLVSKAAERAMERARASAATAKRRESLLKRHHMELLQRKRTSQSSCASQSTKRSRHSRSGSSRHYWDIGGSVGSVGSGPAMSSALGGWGEV